MTAPPAGKAVPALTVSSAMFDYPRKMNPNKHNARGVAAIVALGWLAASAVAQTSSQNSSTRAQGEVVILVPKADASRAAGLLIRAVRPR